MTMTNNIFQAMPNYSFAYFHHPVTYFVKQWPTIHIFYDESVAHWSQYRWDGIACLEASQFRSESQPEQGIMTPCIDIH